MSSYLNKTGRPMVYSCSWPAYQIGNHPNYSAIAEHCNLWRNFDDIGKPNIVTFGETKPNIATFGETLMILVSQTLKTWEKISRALQLLQIFFLSYWYR
jgi:Alpha galactosidase A